MGKFTIRIEHGERKGVKISDGFFDKGSRITTSANRCVLFNVLRNKFYIDFHGLEVADFCCGSGVVGFEMLSLGAKSGFFVDCDRKKIREVNDAIEKTGFKAETEYAYLPSAPTYRQFDVIFFDPPYENDFCQQTIDMIFDNNLLATDGILIIETRYNMEDNDEKQYKIVAQKKLKNRAKFIFLQAKN